MPTIYKLYDVIDTCLEIEKHRYIKLDNLNNFYRNIISTIIS